MSRGQSADRDDQLFVFPFKTFIPICSDYTRADLFYSSTTIFVNHFLPIFFLNTMHLVSLMKIVNTNEYFGSDEHGFGVHPR